MHIAVDLGAQEGLRFIDYVDYLAEETYIPKNARGWVDHLRECGNEAATEIVIMGEGSSAELLDAAELLLKIAYELPTRAPGAEPAPHNR